MIEHLHAMAWHGMAWHGMVEVCEGAPVHGKKVCLGAIQLEFKSIVLIQFNSFNSF